jgi:hypothetical protein
MKKLLLTVAALGMGMTAASAPTAASAQEMREVDWYNISMIKWKSGKGERAHEIIEMYEKVDEALGRNDVMDFHMQTGEWHSIVAFKMKDGPAAMAWKENPYDKAWEVEFAKQVGGEDKAKALWAEFNDAILEEQRQIGHIDVNE